jgi:hypothetical protein
MNTLGRLCFGLLLGFSPALAAASPTAGTQPPSTAPSTTTATAPKKATVAELLATRPAAPLHLSNTSIPNALKIVGKTYDLDIINNYEFAGVVFINYDSLSARQAIDALNAAIAGVGYTIVESVRGQNPRVVLTVVPTRVDAGAVRPVFEGNDPEKIPEGLDIRTQIMPFGKTDPDKLRTFLAAVIDRDAPLTINPTTKTITITDTSTHVRAAAKLLQLLESQGSDNK